MIKFSIKLFIIHKIMYNEFRKRWENDGKHERKMAGVSGDVGGNNDFKQKGISADFGSVPAFGLGNRDVGFSEETDNDWEP